MTAPIELLSLALTIKIAPPRPRYQGARIKAAIWSASAWSLAVLGGSR